MVHRGPVSLLVLVMVWWPGMSQPAARAEPAEAPSFARHVSPTLFKLGCSAGQCHGAFAGKAGFRLSLFASDPALDYQFISDESCARLDVARPEQSLLLLKATGGEGHGGGRRLDIGSPAYDLLRDWITAGATLDLDPKKAVVSLVLHPATLTLAPGQTAEPVRATARLADGTEYDASAWCRFEARDPSVAEVDAAGRVTARHAGDTPVLAHYCGQVAFVTVDVPGELPAGLAAPEEALSDPVDRLVAEKVRRLNMVPAPVCDDDEFIRRVHLDTLSVLPTPDEVRQFLADTAPDKRARLIDRLLEHPLHSAQWATRLCDMLGADDRFLDSTTFHDWARNKFERNVPWNEIAYGVLCATALDDRTPETAKADLEREAERAKQQKMLEEAAKAAGQPVPPPDPDAPPPWRTGAATRKTLDRFYAALKYQIQVRDPLTNAETKRIPNVNLLALQTATSFLGLQLSCAQCHKHPTDRWTQSDFYGYASIFSFVRFSGIAPELMGKVNLNGVHVQETPLEPVVDPTTGQPALPRAPGNPPIAMGPDVDPRREVWNWMVAADNPYFAPAIVNRVWAHYLGRGLFEPIDGQAEANPPSHPEVLDDLAADLVAHRYDLRHLERRILNLAAYQRGWRPNPSNAADERNFSRRILRRLSAEQLLDAVGQLTGTPLALKKQYSGEYRAGLRLIESSLSRFAGEDAYVLQIFGKPLRVQTCDCERSGDPSLSQALYLYNDAQLQAKLAAPDGRVKQLVERQPDDGVVLEELYLAAFSRRPTADETARTLAYVSALPDRFQAWQDVLWSLLNRQDFYINR
jgi:hypothetical protein